MSETLTEWLPTIVELVVVFAIIGMLKKFGKI